METKFECPICGHSWTENYDNPEPQTEPVISYCSEDCVQVDSDKLFGDEDGLNGMTDVEADADTLKSAGMGTDEDYNGYCYDEPGPYE